MNLLIERGLMFGNLVLVDSPALIDRYNRALTALGKTPTKLTDFHIDISGFSPEVADECGDALYLNPNGANRQFIILSMDQKSAPLLNAKFSTSRTILRTFFEANEAALFALTARDAVAGELDNTVFEIATPARLFDIRKVKVMADTTGNQIAEAGKLAALIERFKTADDAWYDDVLIAEMIELAKNTGDVVRNPVTLKATEFDQGNFWTAHFGGIYIFRTVEHPAAITAEPKETLGAMPIANVFDLGDRNQIAKFLELNGLVEPIVMARGADPGAIIRQKMDFILVDAASRLGIDTRAATRRDLRAVANALGARLPPEFEGLAALLRWVEGGGPWPRITSTHPSYFYTLRATAHPDRDLVNMLLSELSPLDVRQLFICHKELFYRLYADWTEGKQAFVADFLAREYQVDKQGAREALFGAEPTMEEPAPWGPRSRPRATTEEVIRQAGPWGAVSRAGKAGRR
jgi:hypothetical protein